MESPAVSATLVPAAAPRESGTPRSTVTQAAPVACAPVAYAPVASAPAAVPRKLDLDGLEPPRKLSEARLEDLTIDGICGVY
jgi:mycofactocin precursor